MGLGTLLVAQIVNDSRQQSASDLRIFCCAVIASAQEKFGYVLDVRGDWTVKGSTSFQTECPYYKYRPLLLGSQASAPAGLTNAHIVQTSERGRLRPQ